MNPSTPVDTSGVPRAVFSLDGVPEAERYDLWRDSISSIFEVEAEADIRDAGFHAEIDANMFGPVMLARTRTRAQVWHRTPQIMARDGMDHYMIQLYERGSMHWETRRGAFDFPETGLVVYDLAQESRTVTNDFQNMSLIVPRGLLEDGLLNRDDQHLRVLHGKDPMVRMLRHHMRSLKRLSTEMTAEQGREVAAATAGMVAACLNGVPSDDPRQVAGVAMAQVTRLREFIEANLSDPTLSAETIAARAGVSRSKLYALFEVFGGVARYTRDRRLRHALHLLTDPAKRHRSVLDISLACGYGSVTAFSRAFRDRYGVSPRDVRHGAPVGESPRQGPYGVDRRYETWLHQLSV